MYRTGPRYPSNAKKASPSTQCQNCLEYGHWTYECKKPKSYKARPTRTQQLSKPIKLQEPEVPAEFLDKRGLANKLLSKKRDEKNGKGKKRRR
ncbi:hypothetical protein INT44_004731 [Umbelopsis vinacea]|uniref:Zinc knuckle-domain-containing protein n=1 Tax=Umbelopsis vinacea TaxID=44442 RepID=A0A8H7PDW0_9FUNG|nr:hypothetical protein INT44_004731 [Umbelopsis vinacea]